MPDYSLGKIYCIRSYQTDKIYIGSTCQEYLSSRFQQHKRGRTTSRILIDYGDAYIELLENFPCASKQELHKREGELIRIHKNNCVNIGIPGRTRYEYWIDNKETITQQKKQYLIDNKEKVKDHRKQYYIDNKEKLRQYNNDYQKQYWIDNKEKLNEYKKQYYLKNKAHKTALLIDPAPLAIDP